MNVLRFVGQRGCRDQSYTAGLQDEDTAVVDPLPGGANVTVRFELDGKPLRLPLNDHVRDFLDLVSTVYIADEFVCRADSIDGWTRVFDVTFPVRDPDRWRDATPLLQRTLRVLSGDEFDFSWPIRSRLPATPKHRTRAPSNFDAVCLFSGGLDSLLGAYSLLKAGKKLLLLGHQADPITASAQTELAADLAELFPDSVHLVQTRVARNQGKNHRFDLPDKCEDSHRPRSFLFLGLAVVLAAATRIGEVLIPENGLIALNSPLQISRLGTLSTRTAYPLFLSLFQDYVGQVGIYEGALRNPFMFDSKTGLAAYADETIAPLFRRSVSCAHAGNVRYSGKKRIRHCGYCVPCLYRRALMMDLSLDSAKDYVADVFTKLAKLTTHKQGDFRALVRFARRISGATQAEREALVIAHGYFSPEIAATIGPRPAADLSPWADMMRRWADDFLDKVDQYAIRSTRQILGMPARRTGRTA